MKKALICFVIALVMALPVGAGIPRLPVVHEWFMSGAAYDCCFIPLFKALGSHGSETSSDIIFGTLYLLSFVISLVSAVAIWTAVARLRSTNHH